LSRSSTEVPANLHYGDGAFGLSEYLSRPCRMKMVNALYEQLSFEVLEKKSAARKKGQPVNRKETAFSILAELLGVHRNTVSRWINRGYQACNANADQLITAAMKHCPERTVELLGEDLETHRFHLDNIVSEMPYGGGAAQLRQEVVA